MNKGNLLIIDDEELLVENLQFILAPFADEIYTASNGEDGLRIFGAHSIQCVICDIAMPKMTGVEVLQKLRERGSTVPFIFFTAFNRQDLMLEAAKLGAFDFLIKPGFENLSSVVSRGLKQGFAMTDSATDDQLMSEYKQLLKGFKS